MKKLRKPLLFVLAALMVLSLAACSGRQNTPTHTEAPAPTDAPTEAPTPEPTAEPTPEPTAEPTPEPTEEPAEKYSFDPDTLVFSDEYITFTVPEGQTLLSDLTSQMMVFPLYVIFLDPNDGTSNTSYYTLNANGSSANEVYAYLNQSQIEQMMRSAFQMQLGDQPFDFATESFESVSYDHAEGIRFIFNVTVGDALLRQVLWSVVTESGVCLNVVHTMNGADPYETTIDTIEFK